LSLTYFRTTEISHFSQEDIEDFFLVNTETGKTWKMTNNKDGQGKWITSWIAFEE